MGARVHLKASIGVLAATAALLTAFAPPAHATFLGENGKISFDVFTSGSGWDIYTVNPDGSGRSLLIDGGMESAWSPDGRRVAYGCNSDLNTCTAAADGTEITMLDNFGLTPQQRPFWSPDARRLIIDDVQSFGHGDTFGRLWRIDSADGSDQIQMTGYSAFAGSWSPNGSIVYTEFFASPVNGGDWIAAVEANAPNISSRLTDTGRDAWPDWSPNGNRIAFESCRDPNCGIYVMNRDGSNQTRLSSDAEYDSQPVWSPDGTKILFTRSTPGDSDLWLMNADGTGATNLTNTPNVPEYSPAWQPVPQPGYVRPKGSTPVRVSLVPAFEQCEAPNRMHGSPLAFGSCTPPRQRGGFMTFGGAPPNRSPQAVGNVRFDAIVGAPGSADEADVAISVRLTDVRRAFDLADGPGSLDFPLPLRLTDKENGAFNSEQATVEDFNEGTTGYSDNPLRVEVPCVETADPTVGSTCSVTTTADVMVPGRPGEILPFVREGKGAIWQLDQIAVYDGGEDGFIQSRDDNTVLAVQGVFVP